MPYFRWRGVDLKGQIHKGKLFARSEKELDALLFKRDVALTACTRARKAFSFVPIHLNDIAYFFRQLADLLAAGVLLTDALRIVSEQVGNSALQEHIFTIVDEVNKGESFSQSLGHHPSLFSPIMIEMVAVGEATGSLPACLRLLADYGERRQEFRKKMRLAIVVPSITFAFFVLVTLVIFLMVIPHFEHIFAGVNREMPAITQALVRISGYFRSGWLLVAAVACVMAIGLGVYLYAVIKSFARLVDRIILQMPFVGPLRRHNDVANYVQSLALLLAGGVPVVSALGHAQEVVKNSVMRDACKAIADDVRVGNSLVTALSMQQDTIGDQELISLIAVAEESGQLARMLGYAAHAYQGRVARRLSWLTTTVQPLFMVVIGLLVALLIFAVYMPIFSLAAIIG